MFITRRIMKSIVTIFFAALLTGCYTQVKSSGDYWGYTGHHHEREKVIVQPERMDSSAVAYQDTIPYTENMRSRDDEGYSSGGDDLVINNYYFDGYNAQPYLGYYSAPSVSLSIGY